LPGALCDQEVIGMDGISQEDRDCVRWVVLDRPAKRNAIDLPTAKTGP
jgi:enoyl-CoA hydratase/carnithine racemase